MQCFDKARQGEWKHRKGEPRRWWALTSISTIHVVKAAVASEMNGPRNALAEASSSM